MKLTLKSEHGFYSVNQKDSEILSEVLQLFAQLLRSAGYYFKGEVTIMEENTDD